MAQKLYHNLSEAHIKSVLMQYLAAWLNLTVHHAINRRLLSVKSGCILNHGLRGA
jgi:hypothetical protein